MWCVVCDVRVSVWSVECGVRSECVECGVRCVV